MPACHSVSVGVWVGVGGRDEAPELSGASHFLEHLLFKGTEARTAREIAETVDAVGGEMNAFTTTEYTAYYCRLPASCLDMGLDLLCEVVSQPAFRAHEVEAERQVILEELAMEADTPDDRVMTLLDECLFKDHALGREVLGSRTSIQAMGADRIKGFHRDWYRPANLVVAVAGAVVHDAVVKGVGRRMAAMSGGEAPLRLPPGPLTSRLVVLKRRHEQAHVAVGLRALKREHPDRPALVVANQVLGGGTASRLFREVREDRGLAYSVYSSVSAHSDCGAWVVYAGTAPARASEVLSLLHAELDRLAAGGLTDRELEVAKGYMVGSTLLGLEDSVDRMSRIGGSLLVLGRVPEVDEIIDRYRAVSLGDVARVAREVIGGSERVISVVGPVTRRALVSARCLGDC